MKESVSINISKKEFDSDELKVTIIQEDIPDSATEASIADLNAMLSYVTAGETAYTHIIENCNYVEAEGSTVYVTLGFYVFVTDLTLPYTLTSDIGEISEGEIQDYNISEEVRFNGSNKTRMDYVFEGEFEPLMPCINLDGEIIDDQEVVVDENRLSVEQDCYFVLRAEGVAQAFYHTITMEFSKVDEDGNLQEITNIQNNITASYVDEDGEEQATIKKLEIPGCVEDSLAVCEEGYLWDRIKCASDECDGEYNRLNVYYNTCKEKSNVIGTQVEKVTSGS